jgi:hypothetical protein
MTVASTHIKGVQSWDMVERQQSLQDDGPVAISHFQSTKALRRGNGGTWWIRPRPLGTGDNESVQVRKGTGDLGELGKRDEMNTAEM